MTIYEALDYCLIQFAI